eukprot:845225-Pyramimonas_sp.AAC.1
MPRRQKGKGNWKRTRRIKAQTEPPSAMGLPPPEVFGHVREQREQATDDYVTMRQDLQPWAAMWMGDL